MNEMEKFEGELAVKRAGLQALRLNVADPSTLMQLKGAFNQLCDVVLPRSFICASTVFYKLKYMVLYCFAWDGTD